MRSERISVLVSPEERAAFEARAKAAGVSTGEMVRRAVDFYDPDVDLEEVRVLAAEFVATVDRIERRLDATLAELAEIKASAPSEAEVRAQAIAEFEAAPFAWPDDFAGLAAPVQRARE
ncbi:MAG: ribbon-helix-helix protein, CopG family [Pseudomonadota bacterium]